MYMLRSPCSAVKDEGRIQRQRRNIKARLLYSLPKDVPRSNEGMRLRCPIQMIIPFTQMDDVIAMERRRLSQIHSSSPCSSHAYSDSQHLSSKNLHDIESAMSNNPFVRLVILDAKRHLLFQNVIVSVIGVIYRGSVPNDDEEWLQE